MTKCLVGNKIMKKIVISGASRGIGRTIALDLANENTEFCLLGTNQSSLNELAQEIKNKGSDAKVYAFNLKDTDRIPEVIRDFTSNEKRIDCLINNAGLFIENNILNGDMDAWDEALDVNLKGSIHLTKNCLPFMNEGSAIIFINSIAARKSYAGGTNYCAAKFGQLGFANSLFEDVRHLGIKVSSIMPGVVNTDMHKGDDTLDASLMLQPSDVSSVVSFILSTPLTVCPTEITLMPQYNPKIINKRN